MPSRLFSLIGRHAMPILAGGIFAGVILPDLATALRPLLEASVLVLLTVSLIKLDFHAVLAYARRPGLTAAAVGWQLLLAPVAMAAVTMALGLPAGLAVAMVLGASAPPITASPAIAQLLDLDAPLVLVLLVATTLLLPLTITPISLWLLDLHLSMSPFAFFLRAALFVGIPFIAAGILRRLLPAGWPTRHAVEIDGLIVVVLVVFAIAVMDGVTARLLAEPATVAGFVLAAFAANFALQAAGAGVFLWLGRRRAFSIGLVSGYRNMAVMLVATAGVAGPDMFLYVAVAQIPMYVLPALMHPLYRRLLAGAAA